MILDPILINDKCLLEIQQLGGTEEICKLLMEQPMPSEIDNPDDWEYTKRYVNTSFRYVLKCLLQMVRDQRGVNEFLAQKTWCDRLLQLLEEWEEEGHENVTTGMRALKFVIKQEQTYDTVAARYPNMGNFLLAGMMKYHLDRPNIISEAIIGMKYILRKPTYVRNVDQENIQYL